MRNRTESNLCISAELVARNGGIRVPGVLSQLERRICILELDNDAPGELALDTDVVIELPTIEGARIEGRLQRKIGARVSVDLSRSTDLDLRYFPRVDGGIAAEYRVVPNTAGDAVCRSWLRGLTLADENHWYRPSPFINFSASGLKCEDGLGCGVGDLLLVGLKIPTHAGAIRATARVVRVLEDASGREIAIEFVDIAAESVEALTQYTLDRQIALLSRNN